MSEKFRIFLMSEKLNKESPPHEVEEEGEIFFFYRPKIGTHDPKSLSDVQRMFFVLRPSSAKNSTELIKKTNNNSSENPEDSESVNEKSKLRDEGIAASKEIGASERELESDKQSISENTIKIGEMELLRVFVIGRKCLPDPSKTRRPYWGYVETVSQSIEEIITALAGDEYETATRGIRKQPSTRPVGEGHYWIIRTKKFGGSEMHLLYKLVFPNKDAQETKLQDELHIEDEAAFIIKIKNPETATGPYGLPSKRRALFPPSLASLFNSRRFISADLIDFLNYEGCEFLLISDKDDTVSELDSQLEFDVQGSSLLKLFGKPKDEDRELVIKPLFEGEWA